MVIRYPNGKIYHGSAKDSPKNVTNKKSKANQPKKQINKNDDKLKKKLNHSNRGMKLEELLNTTIAYYRNQNIAVIHKKPTPVQIVNVDYPKRSAAKITEAYFRRSSTTDYNGIYKGRYLDFEAKETRYKTSFPLQNFHDHQIDHMKACHKQGGIVFVIIYFSLLDECYLFEGSKLFEAWDNYKLGGRKSIPYQTIKENGHYIKFSYSPSVPFIDIIDKLL